MHHSRKLSVVKKIIRILPNEFKNFWFVMFAYLHSLLHHNDDVVHAVIHALLRVLLRTALQHNRQLIILQLPNTR